MEETINQLAASQDIARAASVRRGRRLEYFTIAYNCLEGLAAIIAEFFAGSIALVGFGFDSVIEVTSGVALLWRLRADAHAVRREQAEKITLCIVGICFLVLALYVAFDSVKSLLTHEPPERSFPGIILAAASLVIMPILSRAKRKVAVAINSNALRADAKQTELCTYLSGILLGGLLLKPFSAGGGLTLLRPSSWFPSSAEKALPLCAVKSAALMKPVTSISYMLHEK